MKLFLRTLILLLFIGCNDKPKADSLTFDNLNLYQDYITEVTHGIISAQSDVRVVFKFPVDDWVSGQVLKADLLKVSPKIEGKVIVLDARTLAFVPEKSFKQDTNYQFTLDLKGIVADIPKELRNFTFGVKTIKQQFNVYTQAIQSYSKEYQYLEGQLITSDQLTLNEAKTLIKAAQKGKNIPVKFDPSVKEGFQFPFKVDSISRYEEDTDLKIIWDGDHLGIESSGKNSVKIPGKSNFIILDAVVENVGGQVLLINFSDPLKKGQNLKGLVLLESDENPKYAIEGNVLKVYPSIEIKGTMELSIFEGIQSVEGNRLKSNFTQKIAFEEIKPEVRLLSSGTILPSSNNLKINFETVNLRSVHVSVLRIFEDNVLQFLQQNNVSDSYNLTAVARPIATKTIDLGNSIAVRSGKWTTHALDLKTLIRPEVGAIYRVELSIKPSYSLYQCDVSNFSDKELVISDYDEEVEMKSWDGVADYYGTYYDNYDWNQRDNPCHSSYYYDKTVGTNVLASDIGVTIKRGTNNNYFIAVNNIVNTAPIAGAKVTFYNYQQQPLGQVITEENGTSSYNSEHLAFFAVVESQGQKTYVKLNDGNVLSVSKFKVDGEVIQKGLKGFIYGERGVWRPGDRIFLSFMLNDNNNKLPSQHPVKLELLDPYNKLVHREVITQGLNNFYSFQYKTDENAPTGNWLAKITIGGATFTKTIKVETIKPNRLKIKTEFGKELLSSTSPISGNMEVAWLHGAVAKNLKADITAKFKVQNTKFNAFPNYVFDDPTRAFSMEDQLIFNNKIDGEGRATFTMDPKFSSPAPGMLSAVFVTKVYENGGDFSTDVFSKSYSPYSTYVGLNVPDGDKTSGMLLTDVPHNFGVVTVDENGIPKATENLKVAIYKINWRWWWETSQENLSNFNSDQYQEKITEKTISTDSKGRGSFYFEIKYPDWGRYLVRVEDPKGEHSTAATVYMDWPGWAGKSRKSDPSAATMLVFSTDKDNYKVGESATVIFPSSEGGRALVTMENGVEVLEAHWVATTQGETKFQIPIKEVHAPNVFINISLLQPHATTLNDNPIRLYGIVPITVENPATKLEPSIDMPKVLRPEEKVTVKVKEKQGKAMTYSIAMVDEGLLDLTRFATPDPWKTFYAREALGVKSWDVYDDVVGAFGGRIDQVFAIGGDGELAGAKNKKANRFEPMVVFMGPFSLKAGETKKHEINIPKYVGSVRTMVVAGNPEKVAYGMAEETTPVRKPLMVLASLPRKITPGETVILPVTVFAMENKVKEVSLKLKPNPSFTVLGNAVQTVSFDKPDEKMAYFQLQVSDYNGVGKVVVEASGNGEKASFEIEIDVVNPNPISTQTEELVLAPNESHTLELTTFGIEGSNTAQLEFSTLPAMNFNGRMEYLINYPHGCLEQITSGAFPQLFLADIFEINSTKKKQIQQNVEGVIKRTGAYQLPSGGFSYWPGQHQADDWSSSFVGHFLLEAEKKGYVLPIGFKASWIKYQQNMAKAWRGGANNSDLAQAYRLYTLAFSGQADIASMNRLRETAALSNEGKFRLAATYALIGQAKVAEEIIRTANYNQDNKDSYYRTYGSVERNKAMALETYVLLDDKSKSQELAKTLAQRLSEDQWMSTQSTAYSLLAMAKFAEMVGGKGIKASSQVNKKIAQIETEKTLGNIDLEINKGNNTLVMKNDGDNTLFVSLIKTGVLPVGEEKEISRNMVAKVIYKGRDGAVIDPSKLTQGTNFVAEVSLTNTKSKDLKNIALSQIFPSGWEIVNTRFTDFGDFAENEVTYTDLRDDRAYFYFDMKASSTKTLRILLNASYLGNYYLPGIQAEAMYDNDFFVRTKGQWIEVTQ
ncbi:alpha-2-macroglobulin family protein [Arenibacter certesii]|uniref:Membrane protein n=1 Tax=Arenibacter certesii TaxID=228955 RepID=A0A918IQ75_9FLAO|nr:MG2 domain-containing protein [Arenibacter certesii]GGW25061.1 membrane protein [Arenibacter certesii]